MLIFDILNWLLKLLIARSSRLTSKNSQIAGSVFDSCTNGTKCIDIPILSIKLGILFLFSMESQLCRRQRTTSIPISHWSIGRHAGRHSLK